MYNRLVHPFQAVTCEDGAPVLSNSQFGFRARFSMGYALVDTTEFIRWNLDIGLNYLNILFGEK